MLDNKNSHAFLNSHQKKNKQTKNQKSIQVQSVALKYYKFLENFEFS